jgi:phosphinothricin acetyltransferase
MKRIGVYERVGYKLGEWHDVAWFGMRLQEPGDPPKEPVLLPMLALNRADHPHEQ